VRLAFLLSLVFLPLVGASSIAAADESALTLQGPKATTFGHGVDFAGRLSPKVDEATIRLYRGSLFIAATTLRGDGTYRFNVRLGRPGPFHVAWGRTVSKPILVRIIPKLRASIEGERLAGRPLALKATLEPAYAGSLRVRVVRGGRETYRDGFSGRARVRLGTSDIDAFRVVADVVPARGYTPVRRSIRVALRAPELELGDSDPLVGGLVRRLGSLGYAAPSPGPTFDEEVLQSVYAFQKAQRLERTGVADTRFWRRLASPQPVVPRFASPASHIEIDKGRQILIVVRNGRTAFISPVSTGGGYYTPVGRFAIGRKIPGYDPSPLGVLYKPMYFYGGYAIHGNPSVPPYPASHGCVRVPNFVADRLFASEPYGEAVIIYE
jgi:hypothetical protein